MDGEAKSFLQRLPLAGLLSHINILIRICLIAYLSLFSSNQSRSRSVENLADQPGDRHPPVHSQQRAGMPTRSIEAITNRVINSIGIHRKAVHATSRAHETRSPTLTIEKQHPSHREQNLSRSGVSASAILDFCEVSSLNFLHSRKCSI